MNTPARYAVIGNPVAHSQSPWIHASFAEQTGHTLQYERLLSPLAGFRDCVHTFAQLTHPAAHGCNVTVPFKWEAFQLATRHTARAQQAQAANTLRLDAEGWLADNTDGAGLVRDIEHNAQRTLAGLRILLIGAGGAAAGALGPLLRAQPRELVLANRTLDKAVALMRQHQPLIDTLHPVRVQACKLTDCGAEFDVVVNASASSLHGSGLPVAPDVFKPGTLALDMMYGPAAEGFLAAARAQGAQARDGLGMLVEQAAESFLLWRGVRPDTAPVLAQLRQHLSAPPEH